VPWTKDPFLVDPLPSHQRAFEFDSHAAILPLRDLSEVRILAKTIPRSDEDPHTRIPNPDYAPTQFKWSLESAKRQVYVGCYFGSYKSIDSISQEIKEIHIGNDTFARSLYTQGHRNKFSVEMEFGHPPTKYSIWIAGPSISYTYPWEKPISILILMFTALISILVGIMSEPLIELWKKPVSKPSTDPFVDEKKATPLKPVKAAPSLATDTPEEIQQAIQDVEEHERKEGHSNGTEVRKRAPVSKKR
jgi:hypothetical protein